MGRAYAGLRSIKQRIVLERRHDMESCFQAGKIRGMRERKEGPQPPRGSPFLRVPFIARCLNTITVEIRSMTKWFTIMVTFKYSAGS